MQATEAPRRFSDVPSLDSAITLAVERAGGDAGDAGDLRAAWDRLADDSRGRLARLRYDAANPRCRCADGGERAGERCARCFGVPR